MKKLKLNFQYLQNAEVLTRSQLKQILGGGGPITPEPCNCNSKDTCPSDKKYCVACEGSATYAGVCHEWPAL